ncbi:MAG TPA: YdaU family protein, partial [Kiritimatiellia bacterium]|nr:YdaU family protein [Kiritimatiellia bacterium]
MNYYRHHIGDYLRDTAHLSMLEDAAYRRMLDLYYMREQPLPAESKAVCRLVRARSPEECEAVETVLAEFFTLGVDGWSQKRADSEIEDMRTAAERARTNGKVGGRPRKTRQVIHENPEETQSVISGLAKHNPDESSPSSNHQPLVTTVTEVAREAAQSFDARACPPEIHAEAWADWIAHRRKRRKPVSERAAVEQWRALACLSPPQQAACIAHSIRNDYQGLFPEKFANATDRPDRNSGEDRSAAGR